VIVESIKRANKLSSIKGV